jgi:hypothetical protein
MNDHAAISDNTVLNSDNNVSFGGGVYVQGTFNLNTDEGMGSITGNAKSSNGKGAQVYIDADYSASFLIDGALATGQTGFNYGTHPYWD